MDGNFRNPWKASEKVLRKIAKRTKGNKINVLLSEGITGGNPLSSSS